MRKYENFVSSLENLKDIFDYQEPYANVVLTGMVGLYEMCFEQSWKLMKSLLERDGFPEARTGSPRQVLKTAFQAGMITDEDAWLQALNARNNVAHSYNKEIALSIVEQTKDVYYDLFITLKQIIDKDWL